MPDDNRTPARQFRLAETTLVVLDRLVVHHGLGSRAAAIRFAALLAARSAGIPVDDLPQKPLKKITKKRR